MNIKLINEDENVCTIDLQRYEHKKEIEENVKTGHYFQLDNWKFYINSSKYLKSFILNNIDLFIMIDFVDGRIVKLYNPSLILEKDVMIVETIKSRSF